MHSAAGLLDLHERSHASLHKLLDHCAGFSPEQLRREFEGFGAGPILMQLHHVIGAEEYWLGVLRGQMLTDEREEDFASVDALRAFRARVAESTAEYLRAAGDAELNRRREVTTWGGHRREVTPAHVILRTQTHVFQHMGQIAAMCRLLGRPIPPDLNFAVV
jgi:uncharacterized damage-inducible protein DinB